MSPAGAARDADRIVAAARDAGVTRIDHLITTHYGDHFGAMADVAGRLPVGQFIDHGANVQPNAATDAFLQKTYPELYAKGRHTVVAPGDTVPMTGLDVRVVTSAGKAVTRACRAVVRRIRRAPLTRRRIRTRARTRSRWART